LERNAELRDLVLGRLKRGWSPEQIAGWLARTKTAARAETLPSGELAAITSQRW
jgi:IS30 family transposase